MHLDPDNPLVLQRVHRLEEEALSAVFDAYYPLIYRYVAHHVGHRSTAEDLTGEVFRRLLEQLHLGRGPEQSIKAWLYRVAYHLVVDDSRRQVYRQHDPLDEHVDGDQTGVEELAGQAILADQARAALQHLTPKQRNVVILRFLEGLTIGEVATITGQPVTAVKALQHRGLRAMQRTLERMGRRPAEGVR